MEVQTLLFVLELFLLLSLVLESQCSAYGITISCWSNYGTGSQIFSLEIRRESERNSSPIILCVPVNKQNLQRVGWSSQHHQYLWV